MRNIVTGHKSTYWFCTYCITSLNLAVMWWISNGLADGRYTHCVHINDAMKYLMKCDNYHHQANAKEVLFDMKMLIFKHVLKEYFEDHVFYLTT